MRTARGKEDQQTIAAMMAVISDLQQRIAMLEARGISPRAGSDTNQQTDLKREGRPEQQLRLQELQEQLKETSLASERLLSSRADTPLSQGPIHKLLNLFGNLTTLCHVEFSDIVSGSLYWSSAFPHPYVTERPQKHLEALHYSYLCRSSPWKK